MKKSLLHSVVGANLFENVPCEHLVQFPGYPREDYGGNGQDDGNRDEKGLDPTPQGVPGGDDSAIFGRITTVQAAV